MFSAFVIAYLFLGGTGGGALVVLSLLECANARRRFAHARVNYGSFLAAGETPAHRSRFRRKFALPDDVLRGGWVVCCVTLALGILFLFLDLGRPDRVLNLLAHPNFTAITMGAYALILALLVAGVFCALALLDNARCTARGVYALAVLGVVSGAVLITYTGVLLTQAVSVLLWMTPLVPVLFCLSSLSCGIAVVMLGAAFATTRQVFDAVLMRLGDIDFCFIAAELLVLAAWLIWGAANPGPDVSAAALLSGPLRAEFWAGLVAVGLILPLFLEQYLSYGNHKTQTLMIAALLLFGGAMLRWCVVAAGNFDVTQTGVLFAQLL